MKTLTWMAAAALLLLAARARAYDDAQLRRGAMVFGERCATCHRADGSGGPVPARFAALSSLTAPRLAGAAALAAFANAADLFAFVRSNMPKDAPGSLSDDDALAASALLLAWQGIRPDGKPLTLESARAVDLVALAGTVAATPVPAAAACASPAAGAGYGPPATAGSPGGGSSYGGARGTSYAGASYYGRSDYPSRIVERPLALPRGLVEIAVPVGVDLSSGPGARPTTVLPATYVGATRILTLGLRSTTGFCRRGPDGTCTSFQDALTLDSIWNLYRLGPVDAAYGVSMTAMASDPLTLSAAARLLLRATKGWFSALLEPTYAFGLSHRDGASRVEPIAFPLASSLSFGTFETFPDNRESVFLPLVLEAQLARRLALAAGIALSGELDSPGRPLGDTYTVPVSLAAVLTPARAIDVGASLTFPDLAGRADALSHGARSRTLQVFLAARP